MFCHFPLAVKYERIKFLVIALRDSIEIYAWAPKPYHKFMAFKSFPELIHKPLVVDMTIEENIRLKVGAFCILLKCSDCQLTVSCTSRESKKTHQR